jgi:phage-related protein
LAIRLNVCEIFLKMLDKMRATNWTKSNVVNSRTILSRCHRFGKGVEEIRVWDDSGTYRVIYTARLVDVVYVLHAFQKKAQTTAKRDIDLAKARYSELVRGVK